VFFSYAVVDDKTATLYVDSSKLADDVRAHLGSSVILRPYNEIFGDLEIRRNQVEEAVGATEPDKAKFLVSTKTSWALSQKLGGEERVQETRSLIGDAKAIKNETELAGMRACHIRDGAALIEYFAWLEEELLEKGTTMDEVQGADRLERIRS
jgi:Xaa-Pro aminopeptidase